jgi:hypothetical protein
MASNSFPLRRVALPLVAGFLLLVFVRAYHELLMRYHGRIFGWLQSHPAWLYTLLAVAVVTSAVAAWFVQRTAWGRLALPVAMLVGAITTSIYLSIHGMAVGFVVGLGFVAHLRYPIVRELARVAAIVTIPLVLTIFAGAVVRSIYYGGSPAAQPLAIGASVLVAMVSAALVYFSARLQNPLRTSGTHSDRDVTAEPVRVRSRSAAVALTVAFLGLGFLPGILLGWQLDVYRRVWLLNQAGYTLHGVSGNLVGGVYGVFLNEHATDRELYLLRGLPTIQDITIHSAALTDDGCVHLAAMHNLVALDLRDVAIHDEGLAHIAGLPNLRWLFVRRTKVTRQSFRLLSQIPSLTTVAMEGILPEGPRLGSLRLPTTLVEVEFTRCGLTDDDLAPLAELDMTRRLLLGDNLIRGPGLVHVAQNTGLGSLYLGGNPLEDRYLSHVSPLTLNGLDLNGVRLSEAGIAAIEQQSILQYLAVRRSGITDEQLQRIATNTRLQDAELDGTHLTPQSLSGWRQRDVRIFVEQQTLEASDIQRLGEFNLDVALIDCELKPDAMDVMNRYANLFELTNCRIGERVVSGFLPDLVPMP